MLRLTSIFAFILLSMTVFSQSVSKFIIVDQFGYLPNSSKIAVIKSPQVGFDNSETFTPGANYSVINTETGKSVLTGKPVVWKSGATDASTGDKVWHFDFSSVTAFGDYYVLDVDNQKASGKFRISPAIYNEVLKHAVRAFYYQRVGFAKDAAFAGKAWADGASHIGNLQDKNCRIYNDKNNAATERDVSGGWYDAGDYNKYTNWTASYVIEMMKAYWERPDAWGDNYNIPESGNKIPDLLDEAKWGIDHLLRMQLSDGSVLSIVSESHASPPSKATGQSLYGPPNTSATLNTSAAFAIAAKVYSSIGMDVYADTLQDRAINAWNWAETNPKVLFQNNDAAYGSLGIGAGKQEIDDYGRLMAKLEAACYLFDVTGDAVYKIFFDANYAKTHLIEWNFAFPFEPDNQETLLYYTTISGATPSVVDKIKITYKNAMLNGSENMPAFTTKKDPYLAHIKDYTWGSNSVKSIQGNMFYNLISFGIDPTKNATAENAAIGYIHYIHGVNPLNMVYLSNMYRYGAENGVNEFYHSWFTDKSAKWDRVGKSTYGPAPGFLTGGPNPSYDWDGCCPGGCGSAANNGVCTSESIAPPKNQPVQKSYKDFNTSWPLNSWSVTENSCGYQINYIRLLSKFVDLSYDCNGEKDGTAFIDAIGKCAGGNTGIEPETDPDKYTANARELKLNSDFPDIRIFPNPSNQILNIEFTGNQDFNFKIVTMDGTILMETCISESCSFNISHFVPGIYSVIISSETGTSTQKLVKI